MNRIPAEYHKDIHKMPRDCSFLILYTLNRKSPRWLVLTHPRGSVILTNHLCSVLMSLQITETHQDGLQIQCIQIRGLSKTRNKIMTVCHYFIPGKTSQLGYLFFRVLDVCLRICAMYEAKNSKICSFWTFWPVIQFLQLETIVQKSARPILK